MRNSITLGLPGDLAEWLESEAAETGVTKGQIIRALLEKARAEQVPAFMKLAGRVSGAKKLSTRKGYATRSARQIRRSRITC